MRATLLALARPILAVAIMLIGVRLFGPLGVVAADPIALVAGAAIVIVSLRKSFSKSGELG
jgi:predicted PurR-regulated permease PerM